MNNWDGWKSARSPAVSVAVLVIADHDAADAAAALDATGARMLGRLGWTGVSARLDTQGPLQLLALDCGGVADDALATTLPRIDSFARENDTRLVATMALSQVDLVTANLFGPHVELLCAPSLPERVAAYALSLSQGVSCHLSDSARDIETVRLRRLNEEIARIAETLARLSRTDGDGARGRVAERPLGYMAAPAVAADVPPIAPRDVRAAIRTRRLRDQFFDTGLFEDPAWDILLDLFAAELERAQVSVSSLCIAAAVAPTTALRWIAKMTESGMLVRMPDPFDRRRAFMELSAPTSEAMRGYIGASRRAGLAIA